jgi:ferritin-like metal-binding protein YciE
MSIIKVLSDCHHNKYLHPTLSLQVQKLNIMSNNSQPINNLHNLLDYDARMFSAAEVQLKEILPEWINKVGSLKLKAILQKYLDFIHEHIQKMNTFYDKEGISSISLHNIVMHAFIEDTNEKLNNCTELAIKDACLLACIQAANHYKISMYGTAAAFSKALGMDDQATIFHEAEVNEKQIDDRLSQLAEYEINILAKSPIVLTD